MWKQKDEKKKCCHFLMPLGSLVWWPSQLWRQTPAPEWWRIILRDRPKMPWCQPADNGPAAWGLALSLSRAGKADLGIIPQIIHGTGGSASPTGTSDSPPLPGATACRELFSCLPRSAASDTAAGAKATVSESKPHQSWLPGAKMHTRHA